MNRLMTAVVLGLVVLACGPALGQDGYVPTGYEAITALDRLWIINGKTRTAMISSTHGKNGNVDMSNFHGRYMGEKVMAKIEGPGCVYRIWSAMPSGMIKFYVDGSKRASLACGMKDYLYGRCEKVPGGFSAGRAASYLPIPFEQSIVITSPGFNFPGYYQVSYQTYDPSVTIASFTPDQASSSPELAPAQDLMANGAWIAASGEIAAVREIILAPGQRVDALTLEGTGVIRRLRVFDSMNPADPLEGVTMKIYWDGAAGPAVDAPVDAFFINRFDLKNDWPGGEGLKNFFVRAGGKGYEAAFPMPFARSARVELANSGPERRLTVAAEWESLPELPAGAMRFHAAYREQDYDTDLSDEAVITNFTPIDPATNYVALTREGRGHYVGCAIFVASVGTPWWGEGDEETYIDGAAAPQIQGTGTEDEFNWSWGFNPNMSAISGTLPRPPVCDETIAAQLVPQLRNPECNRLTGHNIAYRFRVSDYVPFERSLKVSYEVLGAAWQAPNNPLTGNLSQKRGDDYASVAYWYELP